MRRIGGETLAYATVLLASFVLAVAAGWLGTPIDNYAYDWMFRRQPPPPREPESILLEVNEASLNAIGGMRHLRAGIAEALQLVAASGPKVVAVDLILADAPDAAEDAALAAAFARLPRLVLACQATEDNKRWRWVYPIDAFKRHATALGHVHGNPGPLDGVSRVVPLEQVAERRRHWALALEAFRLSRGAGYILESQRDLQVGAVEIPARRDDDRTLLIRYRPPESPVPRISLAELRRDPSRAAAFAGKVVFVGVTEQSAMRDRMLTPYSYGSYMPGIEIHANIFETLAGGRFLTRASDLAVVAFCFALAAAAVLGFALLGGWRAYALAALVILTAHSAPYLLFGRDIVFPYLAPVSSAWFAGAAAGTLHYVFVRRQLRKAETDRTRYQQAMHFVTHEMRTPLTAIQGSSELMQRYNLSEEKRRQIADLINSESRRLARMIETFLSVERLSAGQMELRREVFDVAGLVVPCVERSRPLAERKQIRLRVEPIPDASLTGDRELMEYAVYNLLTNAIKYSPADTEVTVTAQPHGEELHLSVADQGIGMDKHELRKIFQKFYRTSRAVASGEAGTGIGLSIVEQIVTHHGGRIEVASEPGRGSCFTVVLPAKMAAAHPA